MIRTREPALLGALLLAASFLILETALSAGYFPVQADETTLAWAAKQVSLGRVPYADFFAIIPPLTLYGVGTFFKAAGASLGALRLLTLAWILLIALTQYGLLLRAAVPPRWAFLGALSFPSAFFPFWPLPSHHWFALEFGLLALFLCPEGDVSRRRAVAAGALCGLSGLCLQTDGALFSALLAMRLLTSGAPGRDRRRSLAAALGGTALPLALFGGLLALSGALRWAWFDLVEWPARFYKQTGGFNNVNPFEFMERIVRTAVPDVWTPSSAAPLLTLAVAMALPLLALLWPALAPEWRLGVLTRRWAYSSAALALTFALFLKGRPDWTHLVLLSPILLLFAAAAVDWKEERLRPLLLQVWLCAVLAVGLLRWPLAWVSAPPNALDVWAVDGMLKKYSVPALVDALPGVREGNLPVLYLARDGSTLYFYWAPVAPPMDWVLPPSARYNSPWEYEVLATFAREHRVRYIVLRREEAASFREEPSPLATLLAEEYRFLSDTPYGVVLERNGHGPSAP